MRCKRLSLYIMIAGAPIAVFAYWRVCAAGGRFPTWGLSFKGTASGGSLVLAKTRNRNVKHITIETSPGESPASIAQRLADTINAHHSRQTQRLEYDPHWLWVGGFQARASEGTLILPLGPSSYILGGTETGLGIPKPPGSLSCSYNEEQDEVVLRWINPLGQYDFIYVNGYWTNFDHRFIRRVPGASTSFTIDRKRVPVDINDMDFRVIGFRDNIPSNAAAIHVSCGGRCQEETYGIPFSGGVAPNWTAWSTAAKPHANAFEQGEKQAYVPYGSPSTMLLTKPFYQVINAPPQGVVHGVYRKFLGLTPGHTYRLTACISTLEMDSFKGPWSFSLHAAPTPGKKDLIVQHLAGLSALSDSSRTPQDGLIALYNQNITTQGEFELVLSGDSDTQALSGLRSSHITLPPGVDTITVWVRFSCSDPNGKVGFSGVKLEDITAIENLKPPEQILSEEQQAEIDLLKWIEKSSR